MTSTHQTATATLHTNRGDIKIALFGNHAPKTVENFVGLADGSKEYTTANAAGTKTGPFYDGAIFHRVIDGFMIQGGGFAVEGKNLVEKESGKGIKNEGQNGLSNDRGTIAMARTNDPNSATAQFFINVKDNAMLNFPSNGGYAVFGKVVQGMDVVDKIKAVKTGTATLTMRHPATGEKIEAPSDDVPTENVVIKSATAE